MLTNTETAEPTWLRIVLIGRNPKRTFVRLVCVAVTLVLMAKFVLLPIRVEGGSMLPTYKDNRINFINRLAYVRSQPKRGDVVGIRLAGPHLMYMKRIIGLPGEEVAFHNGHAVINGEVLDEPYVKFPCDWERAPVKLAPDEYFFVGDNRSMAQLDHTFGKGARERIVGKILL